MQSLSYATGVTTAPQSLYNGIGWFTYTSLPASIAVTNSTPFSTTLTNTIKGGGTISARFTLSITGNTRTTTFFKNRPPLWGGATYGVTAYTGLGSSFVCLQDGTDGGAPNYGVITVNNISIMNKYGEPITNYNFYFMDSETPQANPSFETFTTNGSPWSIFYTPPANGSNTSMLGIGTTVAQTNGLGNMPVLLTRNPTTIIQTVTGGGAMSFGVSLTTAELRKVVTGRLNPNDQFELSIIGPNSGTTITAGSSTGLQNQGVQVISGEQGQSVFTFNEVMAAGSVSALTDYIQTVQVSNLTTGGTALPSTINLGSSLTLNLGDYALVTIVNSAPPFAALTSSKSVNKTLANIGDILTYTIPISNTGTVTANNIVFIDTIPNGTTFISGSLKQGITTISGSPNPPGVPLTSAIRAGTTSTITFQVRVTSVPNPNPIPNSAALTYNYFNGLVTIPSSSNTNIVNTAVNFASLSGITKSVDKSYANCGDVITYTIVAPNTGTVTAQNVVFKDTIPNGTVLVANSVFVNGLQQINAFPNTGVTIPNIAPGTTATLTFSVQVTCQ